MPILGYPILFLVSMLSFQSCVIQTADRGKEKTAMPTKTIEDVHRENVDAWMGVQGVVAVGIGEFDGKSCIKIYIAEETAEVNKISSSVDGYSVIIEISGKIIAR